MKNKLLIFLGIFLFMIIPKDVSALEFTATNGETYQVVDDETFRDYAYYTYAKDKNKDIFVSELYLDNRQKYSSICVCNNNVDYFGYKTSPQDFLRFKYSSNNSNFSCINYKYVNGVLNATESSPYCSGTTIYSNKPVYSDLSKTSLHSNYISFTFDDIEEKYGVIIPPEIYTINYYVNNELYKTFEVEEGSSITLEEYTNYNSYTHEFSGWQYDTENIDLNNITSNIDFTATLIEKNKTPVYIDFPITKEEFYVLLVLLGTLIMMLFLKWCFPYKMGGDLK